MSGETGAGKRGILAYIATRRTWLIPILYYIDSYSGLKLEELKEITGLRTQVLKRALWWLKKYDLVRESGEKIIIEPETVKAFRSLINEYCVVGRRHVFKLGRTYFIVSIKRTRITSYSIPAELIDKLRELESNIGSEFNPPDLSQALGIPLKLARLTVNTKKLLDKCWKK